MLKHFKGENDMNEPMQQTEVGQQENQLVSAVRHATGNLERAEVLRDKLYQTLDRLRGPAPQSAPTSEEKLTDQGAIPRLVRQQERTTEAIETALSTLSEIEQYV
ncbi:MAG: hypothetical protein V3V08_07355 [Nannocystaceae bacterium]